MNFNELMERAKNGDQAAVTELLMMYRPLLFDITHIGCRIIFRRLKLIYHLYIIVTSYYRFGHHSGDVLAYLPGTWRPSLCSFKTFLCLQMCRFPRFPSLMI